MPAPTVEEKVPTKAVVTNTNAAEAEKEAKKVAISKPTTTAEKEVSNGKESSHQQNEVVIEKPKAAEEPIEGTAETKEENKTVQEAGIKPSAANENATKASDTKESEKKENATEKADKAQKPDGPVQPEGIAKTDTDKTGEDKKEDKQTANNIVNHSEVRFGSVEEVALEDDGEEYNPEEGEDAEDDEEGEEGEIEEGDEPMLDLEGLPQSLTASLLEKGAASGPLHGLASKGEVDELRTLLAKGGEMEGKVDDRDIFQYTALHVAAENDKLEACKLLLEHGADIEASTKMHDSKPIHYAAFEGHDEIIAFLLEKGANINALTDDNRTPLYQAAMRGHDHCVKLLLEKGADLKLADKDGKKPADVAEKKAVVDLFIGPPTKKRRTE